MTDGAEYVIIAAGVSISSILKYNWWNFVRFWLKHNPHIQFVTCRFLWIIQSFSCRCGSYNTFPFLIQIVHTQTKVTADQEVMYKYISKNLLFLVTVSPKAVGPIGSATPEESSLVVYIIDTVTGRILHRMTHQGSQGPVQAVSYPSLVCISRNLKKKGTRSWALFSYQGTIFFLSVLEERNIHYDFLFSEGLQWELGYLPLLQLEGASIWDVCHWNTWPIPRGSSFTSAFLKHLWVHPICWLKLLTYAGQPRCVEARCWDS